METQTREQALEKIKNSLEVIGIENETITEETPLNSILDSMDIFDLGVELEKSTSKSITDSSIENWKTFKDVVDTYIIVCSNE